MESSIYKYYQKLADRYDENRFGNSYGFYLHQQEILILQQFLKDRKGPILDLACGTGRLLDFATHGVDFSPKMVKNAQKKHPNKVIITKDVAKIIFPNLSFSAVFSAHLFMHLSPIKLKQISLPVYNHLTENGSFIFDFPSTKRRKLLNYRAPNWHGGTTYTLEEIQHLMGKNWKMQTFYGIMFLPIHRLPSFLRRYFLPLDNFLCRSFLKEYASYLFVEFVKNTTTNENNFKKNTPSKMAN